MKGSDSPIRIKKVAPKSTEEEHLANSSLNPYPSLARITNNSPDSLHITNQFSKYQLPHGGQFEHLLDPRDQVMEHDFDFSLKINSS